MSDPLPIALHEHRAAAALVLDTLDQLTEPGWTRPWSSRKWSPAQVVEHLCCVYEDGIEQLGGGEPGRVKVGAKMERLLRWFLLPHVLFHRSFPVRVAAPARWTPPADPAVGEAAVSRFRGLARRFEEVVEKASRDAAFVHPYFGRIGLLRAVRLTAVHLEHHRRQIAACLGAATPAMEDVFVPSGGSDPGSAER